MSPALLTPEQAGELLGISSRAVMDLARAYVKGNPKGLPGVKVQRDWRFTAEDITAFIEANRARPRQIPAPRIPEMPERLALAGRARRGRR